MELPVPEVEVEAEERGSEIHAHRRQRRAHEELAHRQAGTPTGTTTHTTSTSNFLTASSAELPKYTAPPSVPSPALPVPTPFPAPFDISLSFNVTTPSCINFFNTFIQNVTFRACRPFGMLMSSSQQFQADQSNLTILTAVVGGTCATDMSPSDCGAVMDWHAEQIALGGNCGQDLNAGAALAVTALEGFRSYRMMRTAGCLQNPVTNAYCYVEAVASLLPNDLYFWVASLGIPLPNATAPTCSVCTQSLMNVYAQYAGQSGLVISQVYTQVAERAREACGAGYASAVAITSASQRGTMLSALVAAVFGALALLLQVL
ncbi:hypothetical protein DACRYDRAFT_22092 [Dacryopinax primogenitus]|uniref:DUF7729 domain-containing protein n=1 Tax=Dacryopinax primogenitus (strain DJM 731) TaxID=1858805 RepID=M5G9B2_DACPD|nr:uncharacterized protein DACRYDRAFT_22092 [Dacryopinax primogenitus]EJU02452.1 hypothetical protein DACRYDRAFT_22092 [Dacryopinax primogenitus]